MLQIYYSGNLEYSGKMECLIAFSKDDFRGGTSKIYDGKYRIKNCKQQWS